jgi:hypothetical protein
MIGCITEKKRREICNTCTSSSIKKDSVVYRIDTFDILIPGKDGPVIYLDNPCKDLCDSLGRLKQISTTTKKNNQVITIKNNNGKLVIESSTKDTTVNKTLGRKEVFSSETKTDIKWEKCNKTHKTSFDGFTNWFFYIVAPLLVIFGVFKIYKLKQVK